MAGRLTARQERALEVLRSAVTPGRGYHGLDLAELAKQLGTSPEGAAMTCSSLARRGLAEAFHGGVGRRRMHYQATGEPASPIELAREAAARHGFDPSIVQAGPGSSVVISLDDLRPST